MDILLSDMGEDLGFRSRWAGAVAAAPYGSLITFDFVICLDCSIERCQFLTFRGREHFPTAWRRGRIGLWARIIIVITKSDIFVGIMFTHGMYDLAQWLGEMNIDDSNSNGLTASLHV